MQVLFLASLGIGLIAINLNILGAVLLIGALVVMIYSINLKEETE